MAEKCSFTRISKKNSVIHSLKHKSKKENPLKHKSKQESPLEHKSKQESPSPTDCLLDSICFNAAGGYIVTHKFLKVCISICT